MAATKSDSITEEEISKIEEGAYKSTAPNKASFSIGFCSSASVVTNAQKVFVTTYLMKLKKLT